MSSPSAGPTVADEKILQYRKFPNGHFIRVLTLLPGAGDEPLVGHLTLEDIDGDPDYEAISYVWGVGDRSAKLICDDSVLYITQSIHNALARVRSPSEPRRLWADQICIDQDNVGERSQQVRLMNSIYRTAKRILVWLGRDKYGDAREAVATVQYLLQVFSDPEAKAVFAHEHSHQLMDRDEAPWRPLARLTKLPWFHRIWIVQEIGTGTPATLFWGDAELDWEELSTVTGVLNQEYLHLRARFAIYTPNIRYLYKRFIAPEVYDQNHNRGNFIYELHRARHLEAKDPRDHVYAFLGHFSISVGSRHLVDLKADYSQSVEDVFYDVAVRELKGASTLLLLSAYHATSRARTDRPAASVALPSWVPDWRLLPTHIIGSPETPHRAAGQTEPSLRIDNVERILHIDGVRLAAIVSTSWTFYGRDFHIHAAKAGRGTVFEALWRKLCGNEGLDLTPRYQNGHSALLALMQTLTNGCVGVDRSRPYADIPNTEWLAHGAAYLTRSLRPEQVESLPSEIKQLASGGDPFKWSREATLVSRYRRFGIAFGGYYVLGPDTMETSDVVAVLYGGRTPFVLRRIEGGDGWRLIGECYVYGLMNGEALTNPHGGEETFSIR